MPINTAAANITSSKDTSKDASSTTIAAHLTYSGNPGSTGSGYGSPQPFAWTGLAAAGGLMVYYDTHIQHYEIRFTQHNEDIHDVNSLQLASETLSDTPLTITTTIDPDAPNLPVWESTPIDSSAQTDEITSLNTADVMSFRMSYQDNSVDNPAAGNDAAARGALPFFHPEGEEVLLNDAAQASSEIVMPFNFTDKMLSTETDSYQPYWRFGDSAPNLGNANTPHPGGPASPPVSEGMGSEGLATPSASSSTSSGMALSDGLSPSSPIDNSPTSPDITPPPTDNPSGGEMGSMDDPSGGGMGSMDDPSGGEMGSMDDPSGGEMGSMDDPSTLEGTQDDSITQAAGTETSLDDISGEDTAYALFASSTLTDLMTQPGTENNNGDTTLNTASDKLATPEDRLTMFGEPTTPLVFSELLNSSNEDGSTENTTTNALNSFLGENESSSTDSQSDPNNSSDPSSAVNPDQHGGSDNATMTSSNADTSSPANPADAAMLDVTAPSAINTETTGSGSSGSGAG